MTDLDFSQLSDEELDAAIAGLESGDASLLPDAVLDAEIARLEAMQERSRLVVAADSAVEGVKQFGAGVAEGTAGLVGLLADASKGATYLLNPGLSRLEPEYDPLGLESTKTITNAVKPYLPEEKEGLYPYARTAGEFIGPGGPIRAAGKLRKGGTALKEVLVSSAKESARKELLPAFAAQGAEDLTGDDTIAPLVGAISVGAADELGTGIVKGVRAAVRRPSQAQIKATAAKAFKDITKNGKPLTGEEIERRLAALPDDELTKLMTTGEVTQNAGLAQLEQELAKAGEGANKYAALKNARRSARERMLEGLSEVDAVDEEALVGALRDTAEVELGKLEERAAQLWKHVPRRDYIPVKQARTAVRAQIADKKGFGAGRLHSSVSEYLDDFLDGVDPAIRMEAAETHISSGALQKMRSGLLESLRDKNLRRTDRAVASTLIDTIENLMKNHLTPDDFNIWKAGRDVTREAAETYTGRTAGAKLLSEADRDDTLISRVITGDRKSVKQLKKAISEDPRLVEEVKRAIVQRFPRDVNNRFTPWGVRKFLGQKRNGLRELFGDEHYEQMQRIARDLQSEASIDDLATLASRRQSATSQKETVAKFVKLSVKAAAGAAGGPAVGVPVEVGEVLAKTSALKTSQEINDLLLRAALDPVYAAELARTPTADRVMTMVERLGEISAAAKREGLTEGGIGLQRWLTENGSLAQGGSQKGERHSTRQDSRIGGTHRQRGTGQDKHPRHSGRYQGSDEELRSSKDQYRQPGERSRKGLPKGSQKSPDTSRRQGSDSVRYTPSSYLNDLTNITPNQAEELALDLAFNQLITPEVLDAVALVESSNNPRAVSPAGAKGMYQLMDSTGERLHRRLGLPGEYDPFDPVQARILAAAHLDDGLRRFPGRLDLALADYNAGDPRMREAIELAGSDEWAALEEAFRLMQLDETAEYVPKYRELGVI